MTITIANTCAIDKTIRSANNPSYGRLKSNGLIGFSSNYISNHEIVIII